jgi:hypothetical protein
VDDATQPDGGLVEKTALPTGKVGEKVDDVDHGRGDPPDSDSDACSRSGQVATGGA